MIDSTDLVNIKIDSALCLKKIDLNQDEENGILSFYKFVILPHLQNGDENISIKIGDNFYTNYECIKNDFELEKLSEESLKIFLKQFINQILDCVRQKTESEEIKKVLSNAYPNIISDKVDNFKLEINDQNLNETIQFGLKVNFILIFIYLI